MPDNNNLFHPRTSRPLVESVNVIPSRLKKYVFSTDPIRQEAEARDLHLLAAGFWSVFQDFGVKGMCAPMFEVARRYSKMALQCTKLVCFLAETEDALFKQSVLYELGVTKFAAGYKPHELPKVHRHLAVLHYTRYLEKSDAYKQELIRNEVTATGKPHC